MPAGHFGVRGGWAAAPLSVSSTTLTAESTLADAANATPGTLRCADAFADADAD